ncbi:hypothetical protein L596_012138 [Steinernema carpocapsae]|uniref:Uncharacterized protein n=1 Tax=Steinernema carpocapsae TaxID=34508 RepID=A0A4U5NX05_STECR|nr:hypothetical protein L596_012138 [Steinernema carpocapsae]
MKTFSGICKVQRQALRQKLGKEAKKGLSTQGGRPQSTAAENVTKRSQPHFEKPPRRPVCGKTTIGDWTCTKRNIHLDVERAVFDTLKAQNAVVECLQSKSARE